eukprot:TRINITY_DN18598_c0_g2_i1.p3 TRINITY_DN18598_c0_g2~~TRINITY_DN18598_c0_g2_i1.p3  ORF type:complete len:107 (+),score=8.78 TRINITY_DN18598_c0_g2_i1:279-599(+)
MKKLINKTVQFDFILASQLVFVLLFLPPSFFTLFLLCFVSCINEKVSQDLGSADFVVCCLELHWVEFEVILLKYFHLNIVKQKQRYIEFKVFQQDIVVLMKQFICI